MEDFADDYLGDYFGGSLPDVAGDVTPAGAYGAPLKIPTKNGPELDRLNAALRASPGWRRMTVQWFGNASSDPLDPFPPAVIRLSGAQRNELQRDLERVGFIFPNGMEIDPAGNFNQNQGFFAHWYFWAPAVAALALVTMGVGGYGPLAAALSNGSVAAGGGAAVLPSSSIPGVFGAAAPAITSGAVSASVGAPLLASSSIAGLFGAAAPAIASQGVSGTVSAATGILASSSLPAALTSGAAAPAIKAGGLTSLLGGAMNAADWVETISGAADKWYDKLTHTGTAAPGQLPAVSTTSGINLSQQTMMFLMVGIVALVIFKGNK